jgi:hypothetical protein
MYQFSSSSQSSVLERRSEYSLRGFHLQTTRRHTPEDSKKVRPLVVPNATRFSSSIHWDRAQLKERQTDRQTDSKRSSSAHERRRESRTRGPDCQTDRYIQLSWRVPQVTAFIGLSHSIRSTKQLSIRVLITLKLFHQLLVWVYRNTGECTEIQVPGRNARLHYLIRHRLNRKRLILQLFYEECRPLGWVTL